MKEKLTLNRIMITAFSVIGGMVLLLGAVSFDGIIRLNKSNEMNQSSYKTMMQVENVHNMMADSDAEMVAYFSGNGWKSYAADDASAMFSLEDEQVKADVSRVGVNSWSIQITQGPITLEKGHRYSLSFEGRSTIPRNIALVMENSVDYRKYNTKVVDLSTEMSSRTTFFEMKSDTDILTQLLISLGRPSNTSSMDKHQVYLDNISLIDLDTGKELIKNGDFVPKDIHQIHDDAVARIGQSLATLDELTSDHQEQHDLLERLDKLFTQWQNNNEALIHNLLSRMKATGSLAVDLNLQSREDIIALTSEMTDIIDRIKLIEQSKLVQIENQSATYKTAVYGALGAALVLTIVVFAGVYLFFRHSIIKPLSWTSSILRDMVDNDAASHRDPKDLDLPLNGASVEVRRLHRHIADYIKLLHNEIRIDALSGLANRRSFNFLIEEWVTYERNFAMVLFDIDRFKDTNDTWGHLIGDEVIRTVASVMRRETELDDFCFRYGGEEFGILMPDKDPNAAYEIAERIRIVFAESKHDQDIKVTISAGVTGYRPGDRPESIIHRADEAMYRSKAEGRNRSTIG